MTTERILVPEIHCDHCTTSIEGALGPIQGVEQVIVDIPASTVTVTYDAAAVDRAVLIQAIQDQGYDVPSQ
jgi:copper chaperone